jgi:hypothetical protein
MATPPPVPFNPEMAYTTPPALPPPPRLHWGWVLAINALTRGLFGIVWLLIQANWVRKVRGTSRAYVWAIVHAAYLPVGFLAMILVGFAIGLSHPDNTTGAIQVATGVFVVGFLVLYFCTVFTLRSELEEDPIGIPLGGGMTFFFGTIYFQYHLRDYAGPAEFGTGVLGLSQPVVVPPDNLSIS